MVEELKRSDKVKLINKIVNLTNRGGIVWKKFSDDVNFYECNMLPRKNPNYPSWHAEFSQLEQNQCPILSIWDKDGTKVITLDEKDQVSGPLINALIDVEHQVAPPWPSSDLAAKQQDLLDNLSI